MPSRENETALLQVCSLNDLLSYEDEIVRRIDAKPNGGYLLLLDPQRLLREVYIDLTPDAVKEIQGAYPEFFTTTGGEVAYDWVAKSNAEGDIRVTVKGLFRKETL